MQRRQRRRLHLERLEPRDVPAQLAIGVTVVEAPLDDPTDDSIRVGTVGSEFTLQVKVRDVRTGAGENAAGIIGLPFDISWDIAELELLQNLDPTARFPDPITPADPNAPGDDPADPARLNQIVTPAFPLQRAVDLAQTDPLEQITGLRGASLPNIGAGAAIGTANEDPFSSLRFRALVPGTVTLTIQLAGSMSFADAAVLEGVTTNGTSNTELAAGLPLAVQTTLIIDPIPPVGGNSISGSVYTDTDLDGERDSGESGLPNVTVQLLDVANNLIDEVLTGPDGWYHFEDLTPGRYTVREIQPPGFVNSLNSRGQICNAAGCTLDPLPDPTDDQFTNITLAAGEHAVDYNFGENVIPSKRRFLTSTDPFRENCAQLGVRCVTVQGTAGDDAITYEPDDTTVRVTVNAGPVQEFPRDTVDIVKIDAGAGNDTVQLTGSAAVDTAHSTADECTIQSGSYGQSGYAALVANAEDTTIDGRLGADFIELRDSVVNDLLTGTADPVMGPLLTLEMALSPARVVRVRGFDRMRALSVLHVGPLDVDTAMLNGVPVELLGKWV